MIRFSTLTCAAILACGVTALPATGASRAGGGIPDFNVKGTCADAQKFGIQGSNKDIGYKGCLQDEQSAKDELKQRWSSFKASNKQNCVEQARAPSPSYVEVLTCLEMYTDGMTGGTTPANGKNPAPAPSPDPGQPLISK